MVAIIHYIKLQTSHHISIIINISNHLISITSNNLQTKTEAIHQPTANMQFSFSIVALMAFAGFAVATDYYSACQTADNTCRTSADANMSECASEASTCCDKAYTQTACVVDSPASDEGCFAPYSKCYTDA